MSNNLEFNSCRNAKKFPACCNQTCNEHRTKSTRKATTFGKVETWLGKSSHSSGRNQMNPRITLRGLLFQVADYINMWLVTWSFHYREHHINLFSRYEIDTEFLKKYLTEWFYDDGYNHGKNILSHMRVANDNAEIGVKLMEDFNRSFTHDQETKQYALQIVAHYQQKYPSNTKSSLESIECSFR